MKKKHLDWKRLVITVGIIALLFSFWVIGNWLYGNDLSSTYPIISSGDWVANNLLLWLIGGGSSLALFIVIFVVRWIIPSVKKVIRFYYHNGE